MLQLGVLLNNYHLLSAKEMGCHFWAGIGCKNWLQELRLNWQEIAKINGITKSPADTLNELLTQFADVFKPGLGHCKDVKAKLYLKEGVVPKFNRPRPTALAMKPKVENEFNRQEELGVLEKVEWSAPVVPVVKPTGAISLCGDYKVSVNPHLEVNKYPCPTQRKYLEL